MKAAAFLASLIVTAAGIVLVACASTAPSGGTASAGTSDRYKCFDPNMVRGFQSVDDHTMIITSDWNQAYELKLGPACIGLDTSFMIGIRSRFSAGDVCGPFDAEILYNDMGSRPTQTCAITGIRHLTGDEAEKYVGKAKPR